MLQKSRTSICSTAEKSSKKKKSEHFEVQQGDVLHGGRSQYTVLQFVGSVSYGKVAGSVDLNTKKEFAVKVFEAEKTRAASRELKMLGALSALDPAKANVVQFFESFTHRGLACLAFEMLDKSVHQLMCDRRWKPLSLAEIRPIAEQLLTALNALKSIGVIHGDLKSDNVMLVNHESEPFKVKLIDFGLSLKTSEAEDGMVIQALNHRAPEVTLGLPPSEAADTWALGCLLAKLYMSNYVFWNQCEYQLMKNVVEIVGQPADHILDAGRFTKKFFKENRYWDYPKWWLKTPMEYQLETGMVPKICQRSISSLEELITIIPEVQESIEMEDHRAFVSLLKCLLNTDPGQRISPDRALKHPFVSMVHLEAEWNTSLYVEDSYDKMAVVQVDDSEDKLAPVETFSAAGSSSSGSSDDVSNNALCDGGDSDEAAPAVSPPGGSGGSSSSSRSSSGGAAEEDTDGSPAEGVTVEGKVGRLRRIKKFCSRAVKSVRAAFSIKKRT